MKRREALRLAGSLGAAGLAGCLSDGVAPGGEPGADAPTQTESPTDAPGSDEETDPPPGHSPTPCEDAPSPSPSEPPELVDATFEVRSRRSGTGRNDASVSFCDEVVVDGVIGGNDGCYTAELADASVGADSLQVLVRAVDDSDEGEMCTQGLVDVAYAATFSFEGALPRRVVVEHDSLGEVRTVADVER